MASESSAPPPPPPTTTVVKKTNTTKDRDFLQQLETYLAKRDGVDKLLKISRYTTKLILASSLLHSNPTLSHRLKSFDTNVGVSRKAFRLGKFVQDLNALRNSLHNYSSHSHSNSPSRDFLLPLIAYGGEGVYYFVEQFVWLAKSGLIDSKHNRVLQKISAWAEFVGYFGSVAMKLRDLRGIVEEEACLNSSIEIAVTRGVGWKEEEGRLKKIREKKLMKVLSVVQDFADGVMCVDDILEGNGPFSKPIFMASSGLLSALISTHKNWLSC
ncbi:hypothetical protein TanjilG_01109 [Lupinus angustifolius]|uniref:Peroxisomal membrane protein 11A n=1 Tax=Lupinus angustifolius TaxID=3871 RepID=A0A1J7GI92_LUPAN|nr:PREDICTED: peroxisomal membrane protein 11A [Lupinus angustifolius]OIV89784.1 hypothetical protein TanjilG_01109 [Lupinus angustifolius]